MRHVIEATAAPYSIGNPRRYYAADYSIGSVVDSDGVSYTVKLVGGVVMFVAG